MPDLTLSAVVSTAAACSTGLILGFVAASVLRALR